MRILLRRMYRLMVLFGFDPYKTAQSFRGLPVYLSNLFELNRQRNFSKKEFRFGKLNPCLGDRFQVSGVAKGHYFHQDLLVARRIYLNKPTHHVDVGSRIDGFVAHVASFRQIKIIDIRPLRSNIANVEFMQGDLMATLENEFVNYCDSVSCLHVLEHLGLGRYGDIVNYEGYLAGLKNLHLILKTGGKFYFSVPIGPQRIEFDAHRVFSVDYLLECFSDKYRIDQFSYVDDNGDLHENVVMNKRDAVVSFGCEYGCGIFEMTKI